MNTRLFISLVLGCALAAAGLLCLAGQAPAETKPGRALSVDQLLGGAEAGDYARADRPRQFRFPLDHGPHPRFKTEWWYYTGNLLSANQRRFGYQLTFFRAALTPEPPQRASSWATNQVYMGHFALTDPVSGRFYYFERFSRDSLGLAGAQAEPFQVWLEDWRAEGGQGEPLPMRLSASEDDVAIDLHLQSAKPIVLQGQNGLSQKSAQSGDASYYYSMTRLATSGRIVIAGEPFQVAGTSWLDREWSTSALGEDQVGWDWFSLQFDDGRELMYYQLRLRDGTPDPLSSGVLVDADGATQRLQTGDLQIKVLEHWQSDKSGVRYPAKWRLDMVKEGISLDITPVLADQELQTTVRYWEGAVSVQGTQRDSPLGGVGYVELTGY